jgi:threonine dehydratase
MPENSAAVKKRSVEGYGATIVSCKPTLESRESTTRKLIAEKAHTLIHPYDNNDVIAGAGTACHELISQAGDLDYVFCPVGGGGLISGTSVALKGLFPEARVIGVEPEGADDAYRSFKSGKIVPSVAPDTIADGLRTSLCPRTFDIIKKNVEDIILVSEEEIVEAMRFLWERMKLVAEPSGAVSLAGLLKARTHVRNARVGVILSGGNIDLEAFFRMYRR